MSFLEISGISKTYRGSDTPCLKGIDITLEQGEILVLLGPSGCGKTTLLKILAGLEDQDEGTITIEGKPIDDIPTEKRPISMVFQKSHMFRNMTVAKNISFAPRVTGQFKTREEMDAETQRYIDIVKLTGLEDRMATQLSGGQEQRVSLARALIVKPKLLLLDEPLSALDASLRVEMRTAIRSICKELNQTVIFVTHDQQEAVAIADRIALMSDGRILQCDRPDVFYHRPASYASAMFFGWKNAVPARKEGDMVYSCLGDFMMIGSKAGDGDVMLMVHPQAAMCTMDGKYEGLVKEATYLGTISDYVVECNGVELFIEVSCRNMHYVGETMRFNLDMTMMWPVDAEPERKATEEKGPKKKGIARILRRDR